MILVILGVSILITVVGIILANALYDDGFGYFMTIFGIFGVVASIVVTVILGVYVTNLAVIDEKIAMYEEENQCIELQIAEVVEQYQEYEKEIFTEVTPESSMTLVALYPELKSDELVQQQIGVYVANNEKIKELREKKIDGKVMRWWLYFGQ